MSFTPRPLGFSQGGAVSLYTALTHPGVPLLGLLILSSYLPLAKTFPQDGTAQAGRLAQLPIWMGHGSADQVIPLAWSTASAKHLRDLGAARLQHTVYPGMQHSACEQEISDVGAFIRSLLKHEPRLPEKADL
jgi:predicted esterase